MTNEELKIKISELYPSAVFEEGGEFINFFVEPADFKTVAQMLRNTPELNFDYLFCLTGVDWKTHLAVVYHLSSTTYRNNIVLKVKLDRNKPEVETVCDIWKTAEFHEREAYDFFGIIFLNHPDLRRLFLTDDWVGFPLRKDYDDPVNMIKL